MNKLIPFKFYKDSLGSDNYLGIVLAENEADAKKIVGNYFLDHSDEASGVTLDDYEITIEPVINYGDGIIIVDKY